MAIHMTSILLSVVLVYLYLSVPVANGQLLITEIQYNTRTYDDLFEFIELYALPAGGAQDISGWSIPVVGYTFPSSTVIAPGQYLVVAANRAEFLRAYTYLLPNQVVGNFKTTLDNSGPDVELKDASGVTRITVNIDTGKPHTILSDGFGPSLELMCYNTAFQNRDTAWITSPLPQNLDSHVEYSGTPGKNNSWMSCLPVAATTVSTSQLHISEIMYSPVSQKSEEQEHEFIEIFNNGNTAFDLSQWRVVSKAGVRFTFTAGSTIAAGGLIVVVKNKTEFNSVYPGRAAANVYGSYIGTLKNGGDYIAIVDPYGRSIAFAQYESNALGWPIVCDGLGASQGDLPATHPYKSNYSSYLYKGQSLSRRTIQTAPDKYHAWAALDPSPLAANFDTSPILLPILTAQVISPTNMSYIYKTTPVTIEAKLRPSPLPAGLTVSVSITWFIDDLMGNTAQPTAPKTVAMAYNATADSYQITITPQDLTAVAIGGIIESRVIRYTVKATFSNGKTATEPDIKDPWIYLSYFVFPPPHASGTSSWHIFMRPNLWEALRTNADGCGNSECRRVYNGAPCSERTEWDGSVITSIIHSSSGQVLDYVSVRYQGSRWNRPNGEPVSGFPNGPPGGLKAYSFRIGIPSWGNVMGSGDITLHKMLQGCTMYQTPFFNRVAEMTGVMGSPVWFSRLHLNGNFFRYMMVLWSGSSDWTSRWSSIVNRRCLHQSSERTGNFFKVQGNAGSTEAGWGRGDFGVLPASCGYTELQRYETTYNRKTLSDFGTHQAMSAQIHAVNDNILGTTGSWTDQQRRDYLSSTMDLNSIINYIIIINFGGTWDQTFQNQYLHQRVTDGKWTVHPWDADAMWQQATDRDLYAGDTSQQNYFRMPILRYFKSDVDQRYRLFQKTFHDKTFLNNFLNSLNTEYDRTQALSGYGIVSQNLDDCINTLSSYFNTRWDYVNNALGSVDASVNASYEMEKLWCPVKPNITRLYNLFQNPPGAPLLPIMLRATKTDVALSWYPPRRWAGPNTTFTIERASLPAASVPSGIPSSSTTSFPASLTFAAHPTTPTLVITDAANFGQVVNFVDTSVAYDTYYVYRIKVDAGSWVMISATTLPLCQDLDEDTCVGLNPTCLWCGTQLPDNTLNWTCQGVCSSPWCNAKLIKSNCDNCIDKTGAHTWSWNQYVNKGSCYPTALDCIPSTVIRSCSSCRINPGCGFCTWLGSGGVGACTTSNYSSLCNPVGTWLEENCGDASFRVWIDPTNITTDFQLQTILTELLSNITMVSSNNLTVVVSLEPSNFSTPTHVLYNVQLEFGDDLVPSKAILASDVQDKSKDPGSTLVTVLGINGIEVDLPKNATVGDSSNTQPAWVWYSVGGGIAALIVIIAIIIIIVAYVSRDTNWSKYGDGI